MRSKARNIEKGIKPRGLCKTCSEAKKCRVITQTKAKVVYCTYKKEK